ncbi:MAG: hypothetical protein K6L76_08740 [Agarilytica sp.]
MRRFFVCCVIALFSMNGFSALDGDTDLRSGGIVDLDLTIPETIRFEVSIDFSEERVSHSGDIVREFPACIFFNGTGKYSVSVTSQSGQFVLLPPSGSFDNAVKFLAYWSDEMNGSRRTLLQPGTVLGGQQVERKSASKCLNKVLQGNSVFSIVVPKDEVSFAEKGTYGVTISIIVSPE